MSPQGSAMSYGSERGGAEPLRRCRREVGLAALRARVRFGRVGNASPETRPAAPGFDAARFCGVAAFVFAARVFAGAAGRTFSSLRSKASVASWTGSSRPGGTAAICRPSAYFTFSMSPGFQLLSMAASVGP